MVYIYGDIDPWSASGVYGLPFTKSKKNMHVYMLAGGSHKTRILSFPEPTREEIISLIRGWLNEKGRGSRIGHACVEARQRPAGSFPAGLC